MFFLSFVINLIPLKLNEPTFNVNYPQQNIITKKAKIQQKSTTDEKSRKAGAAKQNVQDAVQTGTFFHVWR